MEDYRHELVPQPVSIERYLECVEIGTLLQFTGDGYRLLEYRFKEETRTYTIEIGNWSETYIDIDQEPVLVTEAEDLASIFSQDENEHSDNPVEDNIVRSIDYEQYFEWKNRLTPPADVVKAAEQELNWREAEGDEKIIVCSHCQGQMQIELECSCIDEAWSALQQRYASDEVLNSTEDEALIDPDCEHCEGNGTRLDDCPDCEGSGKMSKFPLLILTNEITGEQRELKLDLAALIVSGDVEVDWLGPEYFVNPSYQTSNQMMWFNVSPYIYRNMQEIGLDPDSSARIIQDHIELVHPEYSDVIGQRANWTRRNGHVQVDFGDSPRFMKPADILDQAQTLLAGVYAQPEGSLKNEAGLVIGKEWLMRPLRPIEQTIQDIVTVLDIHDLSLGLTIDSIDEDSTDQAQVGPAFCILDREGILLYRLSVGLDVRESLENAWLVLQNIIRESYGSAQP